MDGNDVLKKGVPRIAAVSDHAVGLDWIFSTSPQQTIGSMRW
jgi:hypothetical protein